MEPTTQSPGRAAGLDPGRWLDEYGDMLFNFAVARVRNHHVAEDLVQEALAAACKGKDRFEGRSQEKSWLVGILKNKIVDYQRKAGREKPFTDLEFMSDEMRGSFDDQLHWLIEQDKGPTDWRAKPAEALTNEEFWVVFRACLAKLPSRVGQVFMMREMDGVESEAICENLSISKANLWVMLHRARMALRQCLEDNWIKPGANKA